METKCAEFMHQIRNYYINNLFSWIGASRISPIFAAPIDR